MIVIVLTKFQPFVNFGIFPTMRRLTERAVFGILLVFGLFIILIMVTMC